MRVDELEGAVAASESTPVAETSLESVHSAFLSEAAGLLSDEVAGAGGETAGAASDVEHEQPATEATVEAPAVTPPTSPITVNWDDEGNPYKAKAAEHEAAFKALQPKVQELTEFQKRVEREREQAQEREREQQRRDFEENLKYLTPEQQATARAYLQAATATVQARQMQAQAQAEHQQIQATAKTRMAHILAADIGVEPETLMIYNTPQQMEMAANLVRAQRDATKAATEEAARKARADSGADAFIGGGGTGTAGKVAQTVDEANAQLAKDLANFKW